MAAASVPLGSSAAEAEAVVVAAVEGPAEAGSGVQEAGATAALETPGATAAASVLAVAGAALGR